MPLGSLTFIFVSFFLLFPLFSCGSSKNLNEPKFKVLEIKLAKGISVADDKDIILNPTEAIWVIQTRSFTTTIDENNYARGYSSFVNMPWQP